MYEDNMICNFNIKGPHSTVGHIVLHSIKLLSISAVNFRCQFPLQKQVSIKLLKLWKKIGLCET